MKIRENCYMLSMKRRILKCTRKSEILYLKWQWTHMDIISLELLS